MKQGAGKSKSVHVGYALLVKRERSSKFVRERHLFDGKHQAKEFAERHYPNSQFRVQGVRLNSSPAAAVAAPRGSSGSESNQE